MPLAPTPARSTFAKRLRQARTAAGLTQKQLGELVGLDPDVASTRINRYEQAVHDADWETAQKLAKALGLPLSALLAESDALAELIQVFSALPKAKQRKAMKLLLELADSSEKS